MRNISAILAFALFLIPYVIFSFCLEFCGEKLNTMYAISNYIAIIILALIFCFESKNKIYEFLFGYVASFFIVVLLSFVFVGILLDKHYFFYKSMMLIPVPIVVIISIFKKYVRGRKTTSSTD